MRRHNVNITWFDPASNRIRELRLKVLMKALPLKASKSSRYQSKSPPRIHWGGGSLRRTYVTQVQHRNLIHPFYAKAQIAALSCFFAKQSAVSNMQLPLLIAFWGMLKTTCRKTWAGQRRWLYSWYWIRVLQHDGNDIQGYDVKMTGIK